MAGERGSISFKVVPSPGPAVAVEFWELSRLTTCLAAEQSIQLEKNRIPSYASHDHTIFPANCRRNFEQSLVILKFECNVTVLCHFVSLSFIVNFDQAGISESLSGAGRGGTGAIRSGTRLKNSFITSLQDR